MQLRSILNRLQKHSEFVCETVRLVEDPRLTLEVRVRALVDRAAADRFGWSVGDRINSAAGDDLAHAQRSHVGVHHRRAGRRRRPCPSIVINRYGS